MSELCAVGKALPKADASEKVEGRSVYIQDLVLPGMLHGRILYSDRASARIVELDTSEAERVPGVKAVVTAGNTPEIRFGFLKDNTALKGGRVRQYRDEIAAVAAATPEAAEEALARIRVVYEDLPAVFDPEAALAPDAPLLHETDARGKPLKDNRLRLPWKVEAGDLAAGEAQAAFAAEGEYEAGWVTHCCMGTSGCVASFDTGDNLTVHSNTQIPSLAKNDFQEALKAMGVKGRVRVVNAAIGGGFGSKLDTYAYEYIAILLAHRTRRPVKIVFDREEEFTATSPRQPVRIRIRQGCDAEGRLTFRDISMVLDNGAYTSWGATTPTVMMMPSTSLYRVSNVRFQATCVYTNNTYSQAMRGYGTPQVTFAIESNLDELAEKAGIDPWEMRLRNANEAGEVTPQGFRPETCGHRACLEEVARRLDWVALRARPKTPGRKARGVGLACLMHVGGGAKIYKSDGCGTMIKMDDQGRVDVFSGSMDIGQGLDTVLRQIVAETLGIPVSHVNVVIGDTDVCPWDVGVHASRSTFVAGNSALEAARMVRDQILAFAEEVLEAPKEILALEGSQVVCREDASKNTPLDKILRKAHFASSGNTMFLAAHFYEPKTDLLAGDFKGNFSASYAWGCHGVEVEVDTETGHVEVVRYVAAHDVGRAINPMLLRGQVYGAALMGVGYALTEEMIYRDGRLLNPNFRDYKILTAVDTLPVEPVLVETHDPSGPFGAKGIGEPGLVPTAPAIANAIYDAVGVRLRRLPMKPEAVLAAILEKKGRSC
ncbi:MAG: xanthine dehydrogenase family protein molybdopterin-binding subunit [Deferrisomatales bacterium]|nr:xanthine dehydrogenase family protein molybdopterin-binding subunit [Deferrisomatales bacterium]